MTEIIDAIRKRKSSRTFLDQKLDADVKLELGKYFAAINPGLFSESIQFSLIEKSLNDSKRMRLNYGLITNHNTYILGTSLISSLSRVNYGYLLEKIVLEATHLGLSTCWIGYFDTAYFTEIKIMEGFEIPSIVIVGYASRKQGLTEKFTRFTVNAANRNPWKLMFFYDNVFTSLSPETAGKYKDVLEMVRLAPSSGNTQPWRIFRDDERNAYHFFKKVISERYEEKGLHDVDMGICMAHFELTAEYCNLKGQWEQNNLDETRFPSDLKYIITWTCN
jgi:nitroreductase